MKSVSAFLRLLRGEVLGLLALMILVGLTEGIGILLLVPLLALLQDGNAGRLGGWWHALGIEASPSAPLLLAVFLTLVALRAALVYGRELLAARIQNTIVDTLRLRCFDALLRSEWRWLAASRMSDHASLLLTDISRVGTGVNFGLALVAALATMAGYLAAALLLSWPMTALALGSGAIVTLLLARQRRDALRLGQSLGAASRALHGNVQESLSAIKLAKILGTERRHREWFDATTARLREQQRQFLAGTGLAKALFHILGASLLVLCVYVGLRFLHTPIPELLTMVLIFSRLIPLFMSAQQQLHYCLNALPALDDGQRLLATCELHAEPEESTGSTPWPIQWAIELHAVSVHYADRETPALNGLSVRFAARTTTAITGASGAGKSTLADVLMGLLVPDEGSLLVDGVPVTGSARQRWRRSVAYVPQEVFLFNDSIRNNLLWARADATVADLELALARAAATDFVARLPQGLDTRVGDGGIRLSGGERQRLALARALLQKPSLLILDEATSALDLENEIHIRNAIDELHGELTVVIIGHRLATRERADQVIALDRGRLATPAAMPPASAAQAAP